MKEKLIAVVGVSSKEDKFGYKIFKSLLDAGYLVEGVNPADGQVCGRTVFRSLKDMPRRPELVITVVPARVTERVVEECKELGIGEIWMQPGSESDQAVSRAKAYGMNVTFNACFMIHQGVW